MELKDIYEIWDRFDRSEIEELELKFQGTHLKLRKSGSEESGRICSSVKKSAAAVAESGTEEAGAEKSENAVKADEIGASASKTPVKAPLVGTFYAAASPDEKPFVTVGQNVHKGDVVGIIEAMKLMNEVCAPCDGVVSEILVSDTDLVEYDQVLIVLS